MPDHTHDSQLHWPWTQALAVAGQYDDAEFDDASRGAAAAAAAVDGSEGEGGGGLEGAGTQRAEHLTDLPLGQLMPKDPSLLLAALLPCCSAALPRCSSLVAAAETVGVRWDV